jgi:hypothetical protein
MSPHLDDATAGHFIAPHWEVPRYQYQENQSHSQGVPDKVRQENPPADERTAMGLTRSCFPVKQFEKFVAELTEEFLDGKQAEGRHLLEPISK